MSKPTNFFLFFMLLLCVNAAYSQTPYNVRIADAPENGALFVCPAGQNNFAGTFNLGPFNGQSNDVDLDTIYLCFGDSILIDHNGDQQLLGDPNMGTQAGIGYGFYECPPTVTGQELANIIADPCVFNNTAPPPGNGIWIATAGTANGAGQSGDVMFVNNGNVQNFFLGGNPGVVWFAPITYDDYDENPAATDRVIYEGNPAGPCVNVNTNEAFAVAYLNQIDTIETSIQGCEGLIFLDGGLPELDSTIEYTASMSLSTNPAIVPGELIVTIAPQFGSPPGAVARVRFRDVTEPGIYNLTISDGKSCERVFQITVDECREVEFDLGEVSGAVGDTVCVPVFVTGFEDVSGFQFSVRFDTNIVKLIDNPIMFQNIDLTQNSFFVAFGGTDPNMAQEVNFQWQSDPFGNGSTLLDSAIAFDICFVLVGNVGDVQVLNFGGFLNSEVSSADLPPFPLEFIEANGSISIVNILPFGVAITKRDVSCGATPPTVPASDDGAIFIEPTQGVAPYQYSWQRMGGPVTGPNIILAGESDSIVGLASGTYFITISDDDVPPTMIIDTIVITEPAVGLGVNPMATDPLCAGDSSGTFNIVVMGGTPGYTFLWNTGDTTQNIDSLQAPGFYEVTVTDANGCTNRASASLFNPPALTSSVMSTGASCIGVDDGSATVTAMGGVVATDYTYEWSTMPPQFTATINGLAIGTYFVTATDDNGCTVVDSAEINALTTLQLSAAVTDISCFGLDNGNINLTPSAIGVDNGGYMFNWTGPGGTFMGNPAANLEPGMYDVVVTDAVGCEIDSSFTIIEPDSIEIILVNLQDELCPNGMNGFIQVDATGGTINPGSDYTYLWNGTTNGPLINNLVAGDYTVVVTDDNGCIDSATYNILPPLPPTIDSFQMTPTSCPGTTDGEVTVFVTEGGTPIISIEWSNGADGNTITGLAAGDYVVTVTDQSNCFVIDTVTVSSPPPIQILQTIITPPTCFGDSDGQIALQLFGGTAPIQYLWSDANSQTTNPAVGLPAGPITVSITDANNCPAVIRTDTIPETPPVTLTIDPNTIQAVSCNGALPCDGQATAVASGGGAGTGTYTYTWSSGFVDAVVATSTASDLCQGTQFVIAADASGCADTLTVVIPSPDSIELDLDASDISNVSCFGRGDGRIEAVAMGGVSPYMYFWPATGTIGPVLNNLAPSTNTVIVTDANGCTQEIDIDITEPAPLVLELDSSITEDPTCEGDANGTIGVVPMGGNIALGGETFTWSDAVSTTAIATGLGIGGYSVTVTDANGCTATLTHTLNAPPPIEAVFDVLPIAECFGQPVSLNIDTIFGGSISAYTTNVNGFNEQIVLDFPHTISPVPPGANVINILDRNSCIVTYNIFIEQPPEIIVDLGPDITISLGDSFNVIEALFPNGQNPASFDTIAWTPLSSIISFRDSLGLEANVSPLVNTNYSLTVIDTNGCLGMDEVFVEVDRQRNVYIPNVFSPNDDGQNDFFEIFVGRDVRIVNSMRIFDRWGESVYIAEKFLPSSGDGSTSWNGQFKGEDMNPGVYVYLIEVEFVDGRKLLYRGSVTLVR